MRRIGEWFHDRERWFIGPDGASKREVVQGANGLSLALGIVERDGLEWKAYREPSDRDPFVDGKAASLEYARLAVVAALADAGWREMKQRPATQSEIRELLALAEKLP